jgi:hypothetical protein
MLEAVKPVLLEKVDNIWSQFLTRVSSWHIYSTMSQSCHTPRPLSYYYYTVSTSMIIVRVAYILNR